jgi:hypothetical protein
MSRKRNPEREQRKMWISKLDRWVYVVLAGGVTLILLGIYTGFAIFYTNNRTRFLDEAGTQTIGEVESSYFSSGRGGSTYIVSYRFADAQGISHEGKNLYPFQDGNRLGPGAQISVTYLADNPQENRLTQTLRKDIADISLKDEDGIALMLIFISGSCFLFWKARQMHQLLSDERKLAAMVTPSPPSSRNGLD